MPSRRTPRECSCGGTYETFRTGLTFKEVRSMMYVATEDPKQWRSKSRRAVLGFWREMKIHMWNETHGGCDA